MFCPVGGTGRRYGLRIHWENPCRFNSCTGHHQVIIAFGFLERMFGGFFSLYTSIQDTRLRVANIKKCLPIVYVNSGHFDSTTY